ncbi:hypothetical protein [Bacillus sp. NPDC093026]|uniref:hypothetical protein n=1 Tax=Bacillus sp. NPDC093026 TaxID=3363948 RepID=UPI0038039B57
MNNMNSQNTHYHQGNPYHTFENVYTANHEHMIAPNTHGPMNIPNHYHTGKKDSDGSHYSSHHVAYSPFAHQYNPYSAFPMNDDHHLQGSYVGYGMPPYHPYGYHDGGHMMMAPNYQMTGHVNGMNHPNAFLPRYY